MTAIESVRFLLAWVGGAVLFAWVMEMVGGV